MIGRSQAVSLPTYGSGWSAPARENWRTNGDFISRPWENEANADAMIDKYRRGDCRITVVSASNAPISGASVSAVMQQHAFIFGLTVTERAYVDNPAYQAIANSGAWNGFTLETANKQGFWQGSAVPAFAHTDKAGAVACFALAKASGKFRELRGHVLNYFINWGYHWASGLPTDLASRRAWWANTHIPDVVSTLINDITLWELSNEVPSGIYPTTNGDKWKSAEYIADVQIAAAAQQGRPLYINDYEQISTLRDHAELLIANGIPIAGIGYQAHLGAGPHGYGGIGFYMNPLMSTSANTPAPWDLLVTELDYQHGTQSGYATSETNILRSCFANPAFRGVYNWGIHDGWTYAENISHYYDINDQPLPRMDAFNALVHGAWKTSSTGTTNGSGYHQFRGTFGRYNLTVTSGPTTINRSFELHPGMREIVVVIP